MKLGALEGIPSIGAALLDPSESSIKQAGVELLRIICSSLSEKSELKKSSL